MDKAPATSRIIVKNLPKHATEKQVREHFSQKGEVTDVKLKYTGDVFRRFAFVGFRTAAEASKATKFFNNSYMDTAKMTVELARSHNDTDGPRAWSKYSKGSSAFEQREREKADYRNQKKEEEHEVLKASEMRKKRREAMEKSRAKAARMLADIYGNEDDDKLQEFLQISKARSSTKTWSNDDTELMMAQKKAEKATAKALGGGAKVRISTVDAKRPAVEGTVYSRTHISFGDEEKEESTLNAGNALVDQDAESDSEYEDMPLERVEKADKNDISENSEIGDENEDESEKPALAAVSDQDYLKSLMRTSVGEDESASESESEDESKNEDESSSVDKMKGNIATSPVTAASHKDTDAATSERINEEAVDSIEAWDAGMNEVHKSRRLGAVGTGGIVATDALVAETGRIFIRNLPFSCTEIDLEKHFQKFGPLTECHMPLDKETKKPKGVAFLTFVLPEHAVRAFEIMDKQVFQGRLLHILPARPRVEEKKEDENKKSKAGSSYKKKSEADRKSKAGAEYTWNTLFMRSDTVANALAEKLKISKSQLLSRDADSMAVRMALGETHIIQETKAYLLDAGLRLEAFEGSRKRSDTVIIVKNIPYDITEEDLKLAFDPYGTLGRIVLPPTRTIALVEFMESSEAREAFRRLAYTKFKSVPLYLEWAPEDSFTSGPGESLHKNKDKDDDEDVSVEMESNDCSIFVKNISFNTTDESLQKLFEKAGPLRSARVAKKNVNGKSLSMGFGFLEYATKDAASNSLKTLQHVKLEGHTLELKWARDKGSNSATAEVRKVSIGEAKSTKLMIRNMPFEATKKEVRELFSTFGKLKSVRVPKKFDGTSRGFGFVEFVSKSEAKNAFEALKTTHFYGRHLVLEWANDDMSVEEMRDHTLKHYVDENGQLGRQSKRTKVEI
eukprot:CFRG0915T1